MLPVPCVTVFTKELLTYDITYLSVSNYNRPWQPDTSQEMLLKRERDTDSKREEEREGERCSAVPPLGSAFQYCRIQYTVLQTFRLY